MFGNGKTVEVLTTVARESNSHDFKFRMLTEISSGHFGLNGLQTKVEKLRECIDSLKEEELKQ